MSETPNGAHRFEELRPLLAQATTRTFRRQTVIVSEGDVSDSCHLVLAGRVKVFVSDEHGREIVLATHGAGEFFLETGVDDTLRCTSVITLEPSRIAIFPRAALVEFVLAHSDVALAMMQKMGRHIRALTQKVKNLALMDVYGRVSKLLAELSSANGGTRVIERLTQQEIANRVGASREMISRVMRDLAAGGYIAVDKKHITILKRPRYH